MSDTDDRNIPAPNHRIDINERRSQPRPPQGIFKPEPPPPPPAPPYGLVVTQSHLTVAQFAQLSEALNKIEKLAEKLEQKR